MSKVNELDLNYEFYFLGSFHKEMPYFFSHADALLVSLKSDIFSLTIPNKVQSYMACGKPIIASLSGEGKKIIEESKSGYVSEPDDYISFSNSIIKF